MNWLNKERKNFLRLLEELDVLLAVQENGLDLVQDIVLDPVLQIV